MKTSTRISHPSGDLGSLRRPHEVTVGYCSSLARRLLDQITQCEILGGSPPRLYHFGKPVFVRYQNKPCLRSDLIEMVTCGLKLEQLARTTRWLKLELDAFLIQREVQR